MFYIGKGIEDHPNHPMDQSVKLYIWISTNFIEYISMNPVIILEFPFAPFEYIPSIVCWPKTTDNIRIILKMFLGLETVLETEWIKWMLANSRHILCLKNVMFFTQVNLKRKKEDRGQLSRNTISDQSSKLVNLLKLLLD